MRQFVFKRTRNGKKGRTWWGEYRLDGDLIPTRLSLKTGDKSVAKQRLSELVRRVEYERAGIALPGMLCEAAAKPMTHHLADFIADLQIRGMSRDYFRHVENRVGVLLKDCGWNVHRDVSADGFIAWRSSQEKAPRTLNHYLDAMGTFLAWMVQCGRAIVNPLEKVVGVETRGRETVVRRALTDEQMRQLVKVSGPYWALVFMVASTTGLRRNELRTLLWSDVHFDGVPRLVVRAANAKSKQTDSLPLNEEVTTALKSWWEECGRPEGGRVFCRGMPTPRTVNKLYAEAGIPKIDAEGRRVDLHAQRHTFITNLWRSGATQREAQSLARHKKLDLTANVYTDANALATKDAVERLPKLGGTAEVSCASAMNGHDASCVDANGNGHSESQILLVNEIRRAEARHVSNGHTMMKNGAGGSRTPVPEQSAGRFYACSRQFALALVNRRRPHFTRP